MEMDRIRMAMGMEQCSYNRRSTRMWFLFDRRLVDDSMDRTVSGWITECGNELKYMSLIDHVIKSLFLYHHRRYAYVIRTGNIL